MPDPTCSAVVSPVAVRPAVVSPAPVGLMSPTDGRDRFRGAVIALPPGPLRDVLIAVAYGRDAAARAGTSSAPDDRWTALVAVAERAVLEAGRHERPGTETSTLAVASEPPPVSEVLAFPGTHGRTRRRARGRAAKAPVAGA
jgi:hypothetical protein